MLKIIGLNEYIGANLNLVQQYATSIHSQTSNASMSKSEFVDSEMQDEFYDAISAESLSSDEESDEDMELDQVSFFNLLINHKKVFTRNWYYCMS